MKTLQIANPKARKEHICNYCNSKISVGEFYQSSTHVYDGELYTWKSHLGCEEVASELKMFDECDEGVTEEYFREAIDEYFFSNLVGEAEDDVRTTFLERLQMVKENVLKQAKL